MITVLAPTVASPAVIECARCKSLADTADAEFCWYCHARICYSCWDDVGHCGHPEAEAQNEAARAVRQPIGHTDHVGGAP